VSCFLFVPFLWLVSRSSASVSRSNLDPSLWLEGASLGQLPSGGANLLLWERAKSGAPQPITLQPQSKCTLCSNPCKLFPILPTILLNSILFYSISVHQTPKAEHLFYMRAFCEASLCLMLKEEESFVR